MEDISQTNGQTTTDYLKPHSSILVKAEESVIEACVERNIFFLSKIKHDVTKGLLGQVANDVVFAGDLVEQTVQLRVLSEPGSR